MDRFFRVAIRVVLLVAYIAFLSASINHIAYFFDSFSPVGSGEIGSYSLAISIDVTSLVMTIGVMFFRRNMNLFAFIAIWLFILGLTAFSWLANWEFAIQFQNSGLSKATQFQMLNPIFASSFAFLNLVYSLVAECYTFKPQTVEQLQTELADVTARAALEKRLQEQRQSGRKSFIQRTKEAALEIKQAAQEVRENQPQSGTVSLAQTAQIDRQIEPENDLSGDTETEQTEDIQRTEKGQVEPAQIATVSEPETEVKPIQFHAPTSQVRYSPIDAVKLEICQKNQIKKRDIDAAIKSGKLKANLSGTFSKTALENWLKDRQQSA